jgi:hypothetical protein
MFRRLVALIIIPVIGSELWRHVSEHLINCPFVGPPAIGHNDPFL